MHRTPRKKAGLMALGVAGLMIGLAACTQNAATPTPDSMTHETATPDTMMETASPDSMMEESPTPDAMMESPTPDAMMESPTPDAMMESPTPGQ